MIPALRIEKQRWYQYQIQRRIKTINCNKERLCSQWRVIVYTKSETLTFHGLKNNIEKQESITSQHYLTWWSQISTLKSASKGKIPILLFKKKYNFHNDMNFQYYNNSIESKMMIFFPKSLTILIFRNESIPLIIENKAHLNSNASETCWLFIIINNLHPEFQKSFEVWYLENDER